MLVPGAITAAPVTVPQKTRKQKKADVLEHPEVFDHVGLLINEPLALASCPLFSRPTT
jgi:hypothetical protein